MLKSKKLTRPTILPKEETKTPKNNILPTTLAITTVAALTTAAINQTLSAQEQKESKILAGMMDIKGTKENFSENTVKYNIEINIKDELFELLENENISFLLNLPNSKDGKESSSLMFNTKKYSYDYDIQHMCDDKSLKSKITWITDKNTLSINIEKDKINEEKFPKHPEVV